MDSFGAIAENRRNTYGTRSASRVDPPECKTTAYPQAYRLWRLREIERRIIPMLS